MQSDFSRRQLSRRQLLGLLGKGSAALGFVALAQACQVPAAAPAVGEAAPQPAVKEVTTIEWVTPAAVGLERTMYENFIYKFQEENADIKVKVSFEAWNDYMTKLPTMLAGGVVPDMIHQHMSIVQEYAYRGALLDLIPYMERDGVKPEDYIPALFEAFSHKGKTYGIPKDSAAWGVYYNKTLFDEAGLEYPKDDWTLEDFRTLALELTRDQNGNPASNPSFDRQNIKQWGFVWMEPTPTASENARGFVKAFGGDWYTEDYKQTLITDPPVLEDFRMFHEMRCVENSIPTPAQALGQGDPFRAGLVAMAVSFHIMTFFSKQENVKFDYDVTFMPAGPGGQYVVVGCSGWALPAQAKHKEEGWRFIRFLTSLPVQQYIGQQKRWGVSLKDAVDAIVPDDGYPPHFAMVHTDPFKGLSDRSVISFKFPPQQSRVKEIYATHFDAVWTCGSDDIETAARNAKQEVDQLLAELNW